MQVRGEEDTVKGTGTLRTGIRLNGQQGADLPVRAQRTWWLQSTLKPLFTTGMYRCLPLLTSSQCRFVNETKNRIHFMYKQSGRHTLSSCRPVIY
jgi:hypothetical protein